MTSRIAAQLGLAAVCLTVAIPAAAVTPPINGTRESIYGGAILAQTTQTQFGDNNLGVIDFANGSELDEAYAVWTGDRLQIFLTGNLESNFNKLEVFIDSKPGGQNKLRGDNPNVDFNGLNRMGDDGSNNGLRFDTGFDPDYWIGITGGGGGYQLFATFAELKTGGGGTGNFLGQTGAGGTGILTGGTNPDGIKIGINNSNTVGATSGCNGGIFPTGITTGIEIEISQVALGFPGTSSIEPVKVCAFINGGGHDFVSNQFLAPLPAFTCNLGEPRSVDLNSVQGEQFFRVNVPSSVPVSPPAALALMSALMLAGGALFLRRHADA